MGRIEMTEIARAHETDTNSIGQVVRVCSVHFGLENQKILAGAILLSVG